MRNDRFRVHIIFKNNTIIVLWKTLSRGGWGIWGIISPFTPVELAIIVKRYYCITHRRETSFVSLFEHFSFTPKFVYKVRKQHRIVRRVCVPYYSRVLSDTNFRRNRFGTYFRDQFFCTQSGHFLSNPRVCC